MKVTWEDLICDQRGNGVAVHVKGTRFSFRYAWRGVIASDIASDAWWREHIIFRVNYDLRRMERNRPAKYTRRELAYLASICEAAHWHEGSALKCLIPALPLKWDELAEARMAIRRREFMNRYLERAVEIGRLASHANQSNPKKWVKLWLSGCPKLRELAKGNAQMLSTERPAFFVEFYKS